MTIHECLAFASIDIKIDKMNDLLCLTLEREGYSHISLTLSLKQAASLAATLTYSVGQMASQGNTSASGEAKIISAMEKEAA